MTETIYNKEEKLKNALIATPLNPSMWQNRLNYSGSSALVIAIQAILTQCTSNGITHWFCRVTARYNHGSTGSK
jgi:hypothetical protein